MTDSIVILRYFPLQGRCRLLTGRMIHVSTAVGQFALCHAPRGYILSVCGRMFSRNPKSPMNVLFQAGGESVKSYCFVVYFSCENAKTYEVIRCVIVLGVFALYAATKLLMLSNKSDKTLLVGTPRGLIIFK